MPPPQAQAPIVTTLPPVPPLTFPDVQLAKPKPSTPVVVAAPPPKPKKKQTAKVHHHRVLHKAEPDTSTTASTAPAPKTETSSPAPASGAAVLGQLSADDAAVNPHLNAQTGRLIEYTEERLKKVSRTERSKHKEALAQVSSFLAQAKQAWAMNDVVGADTLANKAKILLDELLK